MHEIFHISDIHFGPMHAAEVSEAVLEVVERKRPDLVAISGDLTQRAKSGQFRQARAFVDRLPVPWIAVPGNHDVPLYRVWERAFKPFGAYQRHFSDDLEPVLELEGLLVVGINTAFNWTMKEGRILRSRLREVAALLDAAPEGTVKLVVAHHQLVPAPRFDNQRVVRGAYEAVDLFNRLGVDLVLSGHLHQTYISTSEAFYPSGRRPFLILHAGTTTSHRGRGCERRRYTCNWVRLGEAEVEISHLAWQPDERRFAVESRHVYPRRRREPFALETL